MPIANVGDALREWKAGKSKHIKTRKQAIAVGLSYERRNKRKSRSRSLGGKR